MSLSAVQEKCASLAGWRRALVAFVGGLISVFAQAPLFIWPLLLIILPVMIWMMGGVSKTRRPVLSAAILGWWFGFGHFMAGFYWIGEAFLVEAEKFLWLLPFAVTLLPAGMALFFAFVFALTYRFSHPGFGRIALFAVLWTAGEWLRGHILTGFPWNLAAYVWGGADIMMQAASLMGSYTLGLATIFVFSSPAILGWANLKSRASAYTLGLAVLLLLSQFTYGYVYSQENDGRLVPDIQLRLVQPSIAQKLKWDPAYREENFAALINLTRSDADNASKDGITHVIWPESASPFLLARTPEALAEISDALGDKTYLITGQQRAVRRKDSGYDFFNSVMIITPGGKIADIYDKVHLVPFGEYLPFRTLLSKIGLRQLVKVRGSGFTPGPAFRVMSPLHIPAFVPKICYEILFPGRIPRDPVADPQWILNVTNDAWFGSSFGPYQHLTASRFRAIEEGLPIIRVANTGVSAVIDGYGQILSQLGINERGIIDSQLPVRLERTPFTYIGDTGVLIFLFLFGLISRLTGIESD